MNRPIPVWLVRVIAVASAGLLLVIVAGGIFDQVPAGLLVVPVVVAPAIAFARDRDRRWRAAAAVGAIAVGAGIATLAAGGSLLDVVRGLVDGPQQLLTTEWPSPLVPTLVATVALTVGVATAAAVELAIRERWHLLPLVPLGLGFVVLLSLGAPVRPPSWVVAGLIVLALVVAVLPGDEPLQQRLSTLAGDRTLASTVAAIVVTAAVVALIAGFDERADPRRVEPADLTAAVLDPIEATAALRDAEPAITLFEIGDRSGDDGVALPTRWRIAALAIYDGQRWVPEVTLRPIGERLGVPSGSSVLRYEVTFLSDDVDLVPVPGRPLAVDVPVETDLDRVAIRIEGGVDAGTSVRVDAEVTPPLGSAGAARPATRPLDEIAATFADRARELGGDGDDIVDQLRSIEATMRDDWVLDALAPGGGQQLALVERFITDTQRGTREQFVTSFVLLARSLGIDARVATGFEVPVEATTSPLSITSADAAAWPEVRLSDGEWVAFDPVPPVAEAVEDEPTEPPDAQSPAAAQPPSPPPSDDGDEDDEPTIVSGDDRGRWGTIVAVTARVVAISAISISPLFLLIAAIVAAKWQRRRRRLNDPDPARRVRGAWANTADVLIDAGLTIEPSWTDDKIAIGAAGLAPGAPHELRRLAAMATAVTFGTRLGAEHIVDDAAATSRLVESALFEGRPRWQRIRWRLSLRSLRRSTRSPIVV